MNDLAPLLVSFGLGVLISGTGILVYTGRGARLGPDKLGGRPAAMVAGGLVLISLSAAVVADKAGFEALIPVCLVVALGFAAFSGAVATFGAPRWAQPSWQKAPDRR